MQNDENNTTRIALELKSQGAQKPNGRLRKKWLDVSRKMSKNSKS